MFLSDKGTWGIDTWAMSKNLYMTYVMNGMFDEAEVGSGATRFGTITNRPQDFKDKIAAKAYDSFGSDVRLSYKEIMVKYATANYVSHYFRIGKTDVQVRTSGYARFSDTPLDSRLLDGSAKCDITGILSIYNGAAQFSLVDEPSVSVKVY